MYKDINKIIENFIKKFSKKFSKEFNIKNYKQVEKIIITKLNIKEKLMKNFKIDEKNCLVILPLEIWDIIIKNIKDYNNYKNFIKTCKIFWEFFYTKTYLKRFLTYKYDENILNNTAKLVASLYSYKCYTCGMECKKTHPILRVPYCKECLLKSELRLVSATSARSEFGVTDIVLNKIRYYNCKNMWGKICRYYLEIDIKNEFGKENIEEYKNKIRKRQERKQELINNRTKILKEKLIKYKLENIIDIPECKNFIKGSYKLSAETFVKNIVIQKNKKNKLDQELRDRGYENVDTNVIEYVNYINGYNTETIEIIIDKIIKRENRKKELIRELEKHGIVAEKYLYNRISILYIGGHSIKSLKETVEIIYRLDILYKSPCNFMERWHDYMKNKYYPHYLYNKYKEAAEEHLYKAWKKDPKLKKYKMDIDTNKLEELLSNSDSDEYSEEYSEEYSDYESE